MKDTLVSLLERALETLKADGVIPADAAPAIRLDAARDKSHGDYASNIAMMLAKPAGMPPRALAEKLVAALPSARLYQFLCQQRSRCERRTYDSRQR